jgi:starch synthase
MALRSSSLAMANTNSSKRWKSLRKEFPNTMGIYIGYSNELAHKIYAGCDYFLMPSLFEPCGISQMIAQRYGTLPIVRYTGGLRDTVNGYDGQEIKNANGIGFNDYNEGGLDYAFALSRQLSGGSRELLPSCHECDGA